MDFGIDVSFSGLIVSGFGISFFIWALSRGVRLIFEIASSRSGYVKPD